MPPRTTPGADKAAARATGEAIFARLIATGAAVVEADILQPAEALLDLYGEDIRARAYTVADPLRGELLLRPDFTVPVVQRHMAHGAEPARYTYFGEVFRRQEHRGPRASEYFQVGYEAFDRGDPGVTDAEVFGIFADLLAPLNLRAATGDIGILMAAVRAISTTEKRKARLLHHIWRPRRFRTLLDTYAGRVPMPEARRRMLALLSVTPVERSLWEGGGLTGLRGPAEIGSRARELLDDAEVRPISAGEVEILDELFALRAATPVAIERLHDLAVDLPALLPAVERMEARTEALAARGIAVERLDFEASFGRTTLEYYDGFVFGFYAETRPDLPPVASGGRYDALTAQLGGGQGIPAVGGVIRPGVVADLGGARMTVKLGVPSKGRLMEKTFDWFGARGVSLRRTGSEREYAGQVGVEGVELVLLSAGEIPRELQAGRIHLGVTGSDLVRERIVDWESQVEVVAPMGFGFADLVIAVPDGWLDVETLDDLDAAATQFRAAHGFRLRIATKYHRLVRDFLRENGVADYQLVDSQGATEGTVKNLTAEAIADITSSGETLRANHLKILSDGLIHRSEATLFLSRTAARGAAEAAALQQLTGRIGLAA